MAAAANKANAEAAADAVATGGRPGAGVVTPAAIGGQPRAWAGRLERARASWRSSGRPLPFALLMAGLLVARRGESVDLAPANAEAAVAGVLAARGLSSDPGDVLWVSGGAGEGTEPRGSLWGAMTGGGQMALVRARAGGAGEPSDLYRVGVRLSPEGVVLDVGDAYDVTDTSGVDESRPVMRGHLAAYTTSTGGVFSGVHVLDLDGRTSGSYPEFTRLQRAQVAISNLQQTGSTRGVAHVTYALDPVARAVTIAWRGDGTLGITADAHAIVIDPTAARAVSGEAFVRVVPDERARPGNVVTWAVDRVRAVPWFGDDRMQWLKAVAFTVLDRINARLSHGTTAQDVQDELGLADRAAGPTTFTDPEVGFPPLPMRVPVSPPLPGEGQWIPLDRDAFITPTPAGTAPAFVTSFVRPDVHRQDVRVYVTLWDPRQVALHMEAGAAEPVAANGEHGPGLVPRTPEIMKHLVAGFNGGFQAQHGEYGMAANGIEYLPPKPYAATVVELRDGSNGFGAWPAALTAAPDDVIACRQNLTALVQDGKWNPWGRSWWGGTPPGWPDQIHSARSGICLTDEGFAGYFYSTSISAEDLAQGMLDARCKFGIHLDMNPGHAGFEFYDVAPQGDLLPLARPMQPDWEAEGKVPDMAGWVFRSRRMIRGMGHMLFPRYIQREARDFFYLTSRPVLPGEPLPSDGGEPGGGAWRTQGLPQHGFPFALAITTARPGGPAGTLLRVVRADPRTMAPAQGASSTTPPAATVLVLAAPTKGDRSLFWSPGVFSVGASEPTKDAVRLASGYPFTAAAALTARAAAGVQDEDGMLVWVELPQGSAPGAAASAAMDRLLASLGCSERLVIPGEARALLGGTLDAAGDPLPAGGNQPSAGPAPAASSVSSARLLRARAPDAHSIFTGTPIVPASVWQPLQAKRVRYFYKPPPAPSASAGASADPAPAPVRVQ